MKIKTQFMLFITGIVLIPVLVLVCIALIRYNNKPESLLVPDYKEISEMSAVAVDSSSWTALSEKLRRMPGGIEVVVLNSEGIVLFSTINSISQNEFLSEADIIRLIKETDSEYIYQLNKTPALSSSPFYIINRMPERRNTRSFFFYAYRIAIFVCFILLVFCASVLMIIARSITKSITVLEKATRQICEGNLEQEVIATGGNEITSLTNSLNKMRIALKEDKQRRGRFIMGVSHDLRTPLALIKGYTEAIADGIVDDEEARKKSLAIVGSKITQLEDMIDELINFTKLDTGEWRENLEEKSMAVFLDEFAHNLEVDGYILKRQIKTNINIPDSIKVIFDPKLFLRALENLTGNAVRYTGENGMILFDAAYSDDKITITVSDNGKGITKDELPFIFDPFYRGSSSRREKGSGLGLSVVKSVIDSHGWNINVDSKQDEYTRFIITIPC